MEIAVVKLKVQMLDSFASVFETLHSERIIFKSHRCLLERGFIREGCLLLKIRETSLFICFLSYQNTMLKN